MSTIIIITIPPTVQTKAEGPNSCTKVTQYDRARDVIAAAEEAGHLVEIRND
jgi:hypothetical protein